jgi:membrane associated rhomboid family serine protease
MAQLNIIPSMTMLPEPRNKRWRTIVGKLWGKAYFIWLISIVHVVVFIAELGRNWSLIGSPIQTKPSLNPWIGPSTLVLINMGARYTPCMRAVEGITDDPMLRFPCPNSTSFTNADGCSLSQLCGLSGIDRSPNQWYRFIVPIFLHGGLVHVGANLFTQLFLGIRIEKKIGTWRLMVIYFAGGIFGFVLGGSFLPDGVPSVGCSGSLYAVIALTLLDLLYDWPTDGYCQLLILLVDIVIGFGLGLLPALDNFAHIGGFLMGILLGLAVLESPSRLQSRYEIARALPTNDHGCVKKFFHNRRKSWWTWWIARSVAFAVAVTLFVLLIENFQSRKIRCNWCQYINCVPVPGWCEIGFLSTTKINDSLSTTPPTGRR